MIIIGWIEILYSVGYGAVQAFGADFTLPPSTTDVISYLTNMLYKFSSIEIILKLTLQIYEIFLDYLSKLNYL